MTSHTARTLLAGLAAGLLLTVSGCGGSDSNTSGGSSSASSSPSKTAASPSPSDTGQADAGNLSGDDAKAAKAISDALVGAQASSEGLLQIKRSDADCFGQHLVSEVGTDDLVKYGLLTKDLKPNRSVDALHMSSSDAQGAVDALFGCTDVTSMVKRALTSQQAGLPKKITDCIGRALTEDRLRALFVQVFQGNSASAGQGLMAPFAKCAKSGA